LLAKTAHGAPSEPQHTTIKERKKALTMLPCLSGPFAPTASFSSTMRTSPTKLAGNLTHTPINTPIEAICEIRIFFCIHSNLFISIAVAIVTAIPVDVAIVIAVGIPVAVTIAVAISIAVTIAITNAFAVDVAINIAVPIAIPFIITHTPKTLYCQLKLLPIIGNKN
jgi:hypothetical protein